MYPQVGSRQARLTSEITKAPTDTQKTAINAITLNSRYLKK